MANKYLRSIIFISLFIIANSAFAGGPPPPIGPPVTPIDGGVFALLAAGVLYGVNRLKNKKK